MKLDPVKGPMSRRRAVAWITRTVDRLQAIAHDLLEIRASLDDEEEPPTERDPGSHQNAGQ